MKFKYTQKKRFGQIFLKNKKIAKKIILKINPIKTDYIIEIGPGLGILTKEISKYINYLNIIEIDKNIAFYLLNKIFFFTKINIIQKDVMKVNFKNFFDKCKHKIRIFGNLPYNISINIILYLIKYYQYIIDMQFMVQKEVANRLISKPNNKNYGSLSILLQYYCKIIPIMNINKKNFKPIPKVDSTIIKIIPYKKKPFIIYDLYIFKKIIKTAFNQRRKKITNSLKKYFSIEEFKQNKININYRAENLSIEKYCILSNILYKKLNCAL